MEVVKPIFNGGIYEKKCDLFKEIAIGSVLCVGHSKIASIKKCVYCKGYTENDTYYLQILRETISIVSEVTCARPLDKQMELF